MITHLSLFSGIGGMDIAAEWAGFTTVGQCEIADYPTKVLEEHWPDVPRWRDIRALTKEAFHERTGQAAVDVISGGIPCQPFSVAGKQEGKRDSRYLWPEMLRVIRELGPAWIIVENVPGILRIAGKTICEDLERAGYSVAVFDFEAAAVGARHRRERVMFVGHAEHDGPFAATFPGSAAQASRRSEKRQEPPCEFAGTGGSGNHAGMERAGNLEDASSRGRGKSGVLPQQPQGAQPERASEAVANPHGAGPQTKGTEQQAAGPAGEGKGNDVSDTDNGSGAMRRHGEPQPAEKAGERGADHGGGAQEREPGKRRPIEPGLGGMADGIPNRLDGSLDFFINRYWDSEPDIPRLTRKNEHRADRLKCLGNAVVPQQFYPIFMGIAQMERKKKGEE